MTPVYLCHDHAAGAMPKNELVERRIVNVARMTKGEYRVLQRQLLISLIALPQPQRADESLPSLLTPLRTCFVLMPAQNVCAVSLATLEYNCATAASLCTSL